MLSAALTFGLLRRRALQRRPAQLRAGRRSRRRPAWLARGAVLRAAEPGAVRREGRRSCTACRSRRVPGADRAATALLYIAALLTLAVAHLLAPGLQVAMMPGRSRAQGRRRGAGAPHARRRCCWAPRCRCRRRDARLPARRRSSSDVLYFRSGRGRRAGSLSGSTRCWPTCTGSARFSTTAGRGWRPGDAGQDRTGCCIRCSISTTTLDPRFNIAYRFGAIFLSEPYPDGPGRPDLAIALLEKGCAADPKVAVHAGHRLRPLLVARTTTRPRAEWFDRARESRARPGGCARMAATTLAQGGDRQSSRQLWQSARTRPPSDDWLRNNAAAAAAQLDALDEIDALAGRGRPLRGQTRGRLRPVWSDWSRAGWLRGIPLDPAGTPYELEPDAPGGVALSPASPLSRLPPQFTDQKAGPTS